jgi:hypothetical protein
MGPALGIRDVCGRGRVEFALEVPVAEPVDREALVGFRGDDERAQVTSASINPTEALNRYR